MKAYVLIVFAAIVAAYSIMAFALYEPNPKTWAVGGRLFALWLVLVGVVGGHFILSDYKKNQGK